MAVFPADLVESSKRIGSVLRARSETVAVDAPAGMRGATEEFAAYLAASTRIKLDATWGLGEAGAAGPPNPYGDPAGHSWLAVDGPVVVTRNVSTGLDSRPDNMVEFTRATLELFATTLDQA